MKNWIFTGLLFLGLSLSAQRGPRPHHAHSDAPKLTSEQIATLQSKKLTLALDLSKSQESRVRELLEGRIAAKRELFNQRRDGADSTGMRGQRPNFDSMDERLDDQIAFQRELQEILRQEQYPQWKEMRHHRKKPQRHARRMHGKS